MASIYIPLLPSTQNPQATYRPFVKPILTLRSCYIYQTDRPVLYSYFRSSCSWRVRAALNWKGIEYEIKAVDLVKGEQKTADYVQMNPHKEVPTLVVDGNVLTQSPAILEYLEETRPECPLMPKDPFKRSQVRTIMCSIGCDIQPVQNLKVMAKVSGPDMEKRIEWANYWITDGFDALESLLVQTAGTYSVGDEVTLADCFLVPMVFNAVERRRDTIPNDLARERRAGGAGAVPPRTRTHAGGLPTGAVYEAGFHCAFSIWRSSGILYFANLPAQSSRVAYQRRTCKAWVVWCVRSCDCEISPDDGH
ncbi:hypothetical protein BC938DRAFT_480427 [Jimgerdemannia flammicorona]|uniref:Maleylacetoacetate isomerase n=1 Tax=Jimgerdemannia flammicorona TaxID=994334 RepID=A0A433QII8_9FUNG|nr:hypothetical protein BC938DRAFT_480427 [Jimgerdemannia flammicorona]